MFKIGLKLWSTNDQYITEACNLFKEGNCDFIELYVIPGTLELHLSLWKDLHIPYMIHAPHSKHDVNLARRECESFNRRMYDEASQWADELNADCIVFHPGIDGDIREVARQLNQFADNRIVVENKPLVPLHRRDLKCNGATYEEMKYVIEQTGLGFCLDVGHCCCTANSLGISPLQYLDKMLGLKPCYFHISDNDSSSELDAHMHFGQGSLPLGDILDKLPADAVIAIETEKDSNEDLNDYRQDVKYIRSYESCSDLRLEEFSQAHVKQTFEWIQNPNLRKLFLMRGDPSWESHINYFQNILGDGCQKIYAIYSRGIHIGNCGYKNISGEKAEIWIYIGSERQWGAGCGRKACKLLIEKGIYCLQFKTIYAHIADFNTASMKMFSSLGFRPVDQTEAEQNVWEGRDFKVVKVQLDKNEDNEQ